jgi:hypothetical protein
MAEPEPDPPLLHAADVPTPPTDLDAKRESPEPMVIIEHAWQPDPRVVDAPIAPPPDPPDLPGPHIRKDTTPPQHQAVETIPEPRPLLRPESLPQPRRF